MELTLYFYIPFLFTPHDVGNYEIRLSGCKRMLFKVADFLYIHMFKWIHCNLFLVTNLDVMTVITFQLLSIDQWNASNPASISEQRGVIH